MTTLATREKETQTITKQDDFRAARDELVPSRYALKVGEIDVLVVSDGVLPIPARTIAHNIEPAVRAAWLEHEFLSSEMLEWPLNVAVVHSGGRTILIDAGIGMDPGLNLPQAGRLVQSLATGRSAWNTTRTSSTQRPSTLSWCSLPLASFRRPRSSRTRSSPTSRSTAMRPVSHTSSAITSRI